MILLSILGQYLIALPFLIPLLQQLDALEVFGKKKESKENRKKEVQRQLTEVFSPIHGTVMRLNQYVNLGDVALQPSQGALVPVQTIDNWNKVAEILSNHAHDIGEERFQKWLSFRLVRNARGDLCIPIDGSWANWFLSLEADYQRLSKEWAEPTK